MSFSLLFLIIILFQNINSQFDNGPITRALACMSILFESYKGKNPDSDYSLKMLKCFITMKESKAKDILQNLETGEGNKLSQKELKKYTDYESIKDMSQEELRKHSYELDKALKDFRKMQGKITGEDVEGDQDISDDYDDYEDYDTYDYDRKSRGASKMNLMGLLPRAISGIIKVFHEYISLFGLFCIVYILLYSFRKMLETDYSKIKKKNQNYEKPEESDNEEEKEDEEEQKNNQDVKKEI